MVPFSVGPFLERNVWTKRGPIHVYSGDDISTAVYAKHGS